MGDAIGEQEAAAARDLESPPLDLAPALLLLPSEGAQKAHRQPLLRIERAREIEGDPARSADAPHLVVPDPPLRPAEAPAADVEPLGAQALRRDACRDR